MRLLVQSCLLAGVATLAACSVTVKTQTKYTGAAVTKTANTSYTAGSTIEIESANGDVTVTGVPGLDKISVSTKPFAFADTQADGDAAVSDVTSTIAIDESAGRFYIHCSTAKSAHGSAGTGTTGCDAFAVQVPAGTADKPLTVKATAHNGHIDANGLTGSAVVHTDNGEAAASITPNVGAVIEVSSGNGDVSLAVPADFTAETIVLTPGTSSMDKVVSTDFPDLDTAHKKSGGATSITVKTELGSVTLKKQ